MRMLVQVWYAKFRKICCGIERTTVPSLRLRSSSADASLLINQQVQSLRGEVMLHSYGVSRWYPVSGVLALSRGFDQPCAGYCPEPEGTHSRLSARPYDGT